MTTGKIYESRVRDHVAVHLGVNVSSSTHMCVQARKLNTVDREIFVVTIFS